MPTTTTPAELPYGRPIPLLAEFRDASGMLTSPDTVRWRVKPPSGSEVLITATGTQDGRLFTLSTPEAGKHQLLFVPWLTGKWWARVESFGGIQEAEEFRWVVAPSQLAGASITP